MLLQGKRIFVVEDDASNLAIISTILRRHGAKVLFDAWGSEALDKLVKLQPIDVILLDLNLPLGNNGYDIFRKIRATPELAKIPVALVTA
jgi:CheY-like chemotaxis protein